MQSLYARLHREMENFNRDPPDNCSLRYAPGDDALHWTATIIGPNGTPYEGGYFNFDINFPSDYPNSAPRIRCLTRIFHCNINEKGGICLDILLGKWNHNMNIYVAIITICALLNLPNDAHGLNQEAVQLHRTNLSEYNARARSHTLRFANP